MADDYKDKIEQIRARRSRENIQTPSGSPYDPNPQIGSRPRPVVSAGVAPVSDAGAASLLGPDFKSPWLRDRVTLSLEGQIAMIEQRSTFRVNTADLGYTNRISVLPLRAGIFVKIEPPGTYRLVYHNR